MLCFFTFFYAKKSFWFSVHRIALLLQFLHVPTFQWTKFNIINFRKTMDSYFTLHILNLPCVEADLSSFKPLKQKTWTKIRFAYFINGIQIRRFSRKQEGPQFNNSNDFLFIIAIKLYKVQTRNVITTAMLRFSIHSSIILKCHLQNAYILLNQSFGSTHHTAKTTLEIGYYLKDKYIATSFFKDYLILPPLSSKTQADGLSKNE